jgi:hypothetical protein
MLSGLMVTFKGLVGTVQEILGALASGDCQPLFNAVGRLSETVQQLAGEAWDAIVEFFRPIGDFFSNLWQRFGAPALDWLGEVASDTWAFIKNLGQQIWDWTKPVRDAVGAAWDWVKNQLGIGEGPEGQNGLLQWVQAKAGEAWDWIKSQLQPVIGPIRSLVDGIRAILPLDAILNLRETVRGWLGKVRGMVQNLRQPQDVVQNQDTLRSEILPAVLTSIEGLRVSLVGAGQWVAGQIGGLVDTVLGFINGLRSNPIIGRLAGAIDWIQASVVSLAQWAQGTVINLFGSIGNGLVYLSGFIEPVLNTLQKVISVLGDVVSELPGLVLGPLWKIIPACIREPIKNFIIEHILRNIPIISKFLDIPDIWSRIQNLVMDFLRKVFVNGDLSGAVMTVIRFVLEAAGVNVDLFLNILANAADALETIIMDPVAFLGNLFGALRQGFNQFVSNIGTHLISGLLGWLLGPLQDLGVTPPKELTLMSVLDLVLQILGISAAKLREKAEKLIGPKAVRVLEEAWKWIKALISGGLAGLWQEIKNRLSDLWNIVIGGISQWITVNIVKAGVEWLAKLSNPVGWVVGAIQVAYDVLSFFVNRINQILGLVNAVVSSIKQIAEGSIGAAANWIEDAMDRTLPTIIAFLADLVGISDPAPTVRDIVKGIQAKVDKALDWLVDKARGIGQRILGALGLGGEPAAGAGVAGQDIDKALTLGQESHTLRGHIEDDRVTILMASALQPFKNSIDQISKHQTERLRNQKQDTQAEKLAGELEKLKQRAEKIEQQARDANKSYLQRTPRPPVDELPGREILDNGLNELEIKLERIATEFGFDEGVDVKEGDFIADLEEKQRMKVMSLNDRQGVLFGISARAYSNPKKEKFFSYKSYNNIWRKADPHEPGTKDNPFKLEWPKPASENYPALYFGGRTNTPISQNELETRFLNKQNDPNGVEIKEYTPHVGGILPGGEEIGLRPPWYLGKGTKVGPLQATGTGTPGGGKIINILARYGFNSGADQLQGDHVHEIQLGGEDVIKNLWPLNTTINLSAGPKIAGATVEYPDGSGTAKIADLKQLNPHDFWFIITEVR